MKIIIGADHRGFKLKRSLIVYLKSKGYHVNDVGTNSEESVDYPKFAVKLVHEIAKDIQNTMGIIICGSGIGVSIAVNRYSFVRGALVFNESVAESARKHNDANVLCLAADFVSEHEAQRYIEIFLGEAFEGGRHTERTKQLEHMK